MVAAVRDEHEHARRAAPHPRQVDDSAPLLDVRLPRRHELLLRRARAAPRQVLLLPEEGDDRGPTPRRPLPRHLPVQHAQPRHDRPEQAEPDLQRGARSSAVVGLHERHVHQRVHVRRVQVLPDVPDARHRPEGLPDGAHTHDDRDEHRPRSGVARGRPLQGVHRHVSLQRAGVRPRARLPPVLRLLLLQLLHFRAAGTGRAEQHAGGRLRERLDGDGAERKWDAG